MIGHKFCGHHFVKLKLFIIIVFVENVLCVRINRLQVPEVAKYGGPVVLDCDYTLEEEAFAEGLVVKWFFNDRPTPIYQWIPNKKPQELGILKGRLNLEYTASKDTNSVHRALHIKEPGPDLSGNYTCLVSTFRSEDRKTKRMLVLVPGTELQMQQKSNGDGSQQVICYAEGVFPQPYMTLQIGNSEVNDSKISILKRNDLYDIKVVAQIPSLQAPEEFSCELHVPQANFTVRKKAIYYPGCQGKSRKKDFRGGLLTLFSQTLFYTLFLVMGVLRMTLGLVNNGNHFKRTLFESTVILFIQLVFIIG